MVRFHWHVEGGHGAFIPAGGIAPDKGHVKLPLSQQVQHALVEIEVDRDRALVLLCYRLVHSMVMAANYFQLWIHRTMQISGGQTVREEALLTIPPGYLKDSELKEVGIILAHGNDADEWRGKLLTELAVALAKQGAYRV